DHVRPFGLTRRYAEHAGHAAGTSTLQHRRLILDQTLIIEMTVAIDQHQAGSTQRGKTPCGAGSCVPGFSGAAMAAKSRASTGCASRSSSWSALSGIAQRARIASWRTASAVQ